MTQVGVLLANLTAELLGPGGAAADSTNRVFVNTSAVLFNNARAGIEATGVPTLTHIGASFGIATDGVLLLFIAALLTLRDSDVRFLAVDMPEANGLTMGIMALVARVEREAISRCTKEALAAAKDRCTRRGNPNDGVALRRDGKGGTALREAVAANTDGFAADLAAVVEDIRSAGYISLRANSTELTARGIRTRRGGAWGVGNAKSLLERCPAVSQRLV